MKLKTIISEYGYLAVMSLCLACSAALLISVTIDKPIVAIAEEHIPVLRTQSAAAEGEHETEQAEITAEQVPQQTETQGETEPVKQETLSGTNTGYVLTEDYLESRLASFLPDHFPAEDIDVSFDGGVLSLSFDMSRSGLKNYLKEQGVELGMKRSLLLQMLPRELEVEAVFALSADEKGLHLSPVTFVAGEKEFSLSGLPQDTFSAIDNGLNALLESAGVTFSSAEFTGDGILLK